MTIQKAIEILDFVIQNKKDMKEGFLQEDWERERMVLGVVSSALKCLDTDLYNLEEIKKQIVPECKHPKKMHEVCEGQKYCMACNMDL